jgi:ribosomal protein S10
MIYHQTIGNAGGNGVFCIQLTSHGDYVIDRSMEHILSTSRRSQSAYRVSRKERRVTVCMEPFSMGTSTNSWGKNLPGVTSKVSTLDSTTM